MQNLTISPLSTLPQVRVLGRCAGTDPLTLFWTGSGIELLFTGSELWVELNADYDTMEPWVSVELDSAWISRFAVNPGTSRMCIFRGAAPGRAKHVRLLKDVQAMSEDPAHLLQVTAICHAGGEFLPLPAPRCRLEFIGDSITSGEGAIGAVCETDWISTFFSAENHYGRMTADALGAEYRVVSASGWGLVSGWDNDPRCTLAPCYTQVCGLAAGERNAALGAQQPYDFAAWPADAVILNLGTNDWNAFHNPPWVDPETGRSFKQTLADDGSFAPADAARLAAAVPLPMLPGWRQLCETFWRWYASTIPTLSSCGLTACWAAVCCRCCGTGWTNTAPSAVMSGCICWNCLRQGAIPSVPDSTPVPPPTALRPIVWRSFCAVCCNF